VRRKRLDHLPFVERRCAARCCARRASALGYNGLVVRGLSGEVRIAKESDFQHADPRGSCAQLASRSAENSWRDGQRSLDVVDAGNAPRSPASPYNSRRSRGIRQSVEQSISSVERAASNELGTVEPLIQRQGVDRILVAGAGAFSDPGGRSKPAQDAKLTFRMVE